MIKYLLMINLFFVHSAAFGALAGGRPNAFSGGQNAFAGVVNPANAVWIKDRFDLGTFLVHQESSLNNRDNNPLFPRGKLDLTHRCKNLFSADAAVHKQIKLGLIESSFSLAAYTMPSRGKLRAKQPIALVGTTPIFVENKTDVISAVLSFKLCTTHSVGCSLDYCYLSHQRNGFQNSDNPLRSVAPGHVTNRGKDHSHGLGLTLGWRWNVTKKLDFGAAWAKKSYCGQYRKYQGYEPYHGKNYIPQMLGAGFTYRFSSKLTGRLETLWSNLGNLPNSNNNVLPDGKLNLHKRGSNKSPGPGLQNATYIDIGMGYKVKEGLFVGGGWSHRIKLPRKTQNILSHSYALQTIYDIISLGANFNCKKHSLFLVCSYSFKNSVSGLMPEELGGGRFSGEKQTMSASVSWGYRY